MCACVCACVPAAPPQVYDAFADLVASKVAALRVGDGLSPDTTHGPLITPAGVEKVRRLTKQGRAV